MKAANTRVAVFEAATAAALTLDLNKFFRGEAVGAFAAGFIGEKEFLDLQYSYDGATHVAIVIYTE